jgi:TPR repeat protein
MFRSWTSLPAIDALVSRIDLLEKQIQTYQSEISNCLERSQSACEGVARLERELKCEQFYRQGQEYLYGDRQLPRHHQFGLSLLKQAADCGHSDSIIALGRIHQSNKFHAKNEEESARYFSLSAAQGNGFGQYQYACCLYWGLGVTRNTEKAVRYCKLSADQGNSWGQTGYGFCFLDGVGIGQNAADAVN